MAVTACSSSPDHATDDLSTPRAAAIQSLLDAWAGAGAGGVVVALADRTTPQLVVAAGSDGRDGGILQPDSPFRVGSLTKTFVAVMVLQLVADGRIALDDPVTKHLPELTIADGVTIRQLLAHRSGIPEHTDGELAPEVLADPDRPWTPADVIALVQDQQPDFSPGAQFAYSNTNYVVAGLLLEHVTAMSVADNLDLRIVEPLGLRSTYLAPDPTREPIEGYSRSLAGGSTNGGSYRALETAAGAAGAAVSTAPDLATFIRALVNGELLPSAVYAEMTTGLPAEGETLGVFPSSPPSATGISNAGAIPGFSAFMQYDPATEGLLVLLVNDDTRSLDQLGADLTAILEQE